MENLLKEINFLANSKGANAWIRDRLQHLHRAIRVQSAATRLVTAAAIKQGLMICSVPRPGRHADVIRQMATAGIAIPIDGEQGFLTSDGLFVGRQKAMEIALKAEQLMPKSRNGVPFTQECHELFSEDVW